MLATICTTLLFGEHGIVLYATQYSKCVYYISNAVFRFRLTPLLCLCLSYYIALIFSRNCSHYCSIVQYSECSKCQCSLHANNLERFTIFSHDAAITRLIIASLSHSILYVLTLNNRDKPFNTVSGLEQPRFDSRQVQTFLSSPHHRNRVCDQPILVFGGYRGSKLAADVSLVLNLRNA